MEETILYRQIIAAMRQKIQSGTLKPGDRLPSIRHLTTEWNCTPGTVQRAYRELAEQGLIISRPGQGTHVVLNLPHSDDTPIRRANLVFRAQSFLLEAFTAGHSPEEVEIAMHLALDQWRVVSAESQPAIEDTLRFSGSHDLALTWIAAHFSKIVPGFALDLQFSGSLGGLIALAENKADFAGCHLWDSETNSYNTPFVRRVLTGQRIALLTLAWRQQGLMTQPGNPLEIHTVADLGRNELRFVNRQPGSGTRVWLDAALQREGIASDQIAGYDNICPTHLEVARAVAEGAADVGFGLQTSAQTFGLDFIPLVDERYDLVIPEKVAYYPAMERLIDWLQTDAARKAIAEIGGYHTGNTGQMDWLN